MKAWGGRAGGGKFSKNKRNIFGNNVGNKNDIMKAKFFKWRISTREKKDKNDLHYWSAKTTNWSLSINFSMAIEMGDEGIG